MSEKPTPDMTPGLISWKELNTRDAGGAKKFYGALFGWETEEVDMGKGTYTIFKTGETTVAGMFEYPPELAHLPVIWLNYVTVENLEEALKKTVELGGFIHKEIVELNMGRFAIIGDPQGAGLGLWEFKSPDDSKP